MGFSRTELFARYQPGGLRTVVDEATITGSIFWVDGNNTKAGDTAGHGANPVDGPLATIDYAIGLATASKGDVIFVMPGHTETLAADITADKIGLSIIGLGQGALKPTITFDTTTDEIHITAASCRLKNFRLVSDVNNLVNFIDNDAAFTIIEDCDFVTSNTKEAYCFINQATTVDDLTVRNCTAYQPTDPDGTGAAAGTGFLYCEDSERINIEGCKIIGNFETAIVHNKTTKVQELIIKDSIFKQDLAGASHLVLVAASTGAMIRSNGRNPNATDATVAQLVGSIDATFWLSADTFFGNDSAAGGSLQVVGDAACS